MDENSKLCDCCKNDEAVIKVSYINLLSFNTTTNDIIQTELDLCAFCQNLERFLLFELIKKNRKIKHEDIIKKAQSYKRHTTQRFITLAPEGMFINEASDV